MRVNKKIVMVLGVLITALLGNSVTANAASDNTYRWVVDSDGNYVNLDVSDDFTRSNATWVTDSSSIKDSASFESSDGKKTISFTTSSTSGQKVTQEVAERSFSNIQSQIASSGLQTVVVAPIKQRYNDDGILGYSGTFYVGVDDTPIQWFAYNIFQIGAGNALTLTYGTVDVDDNDITKYVTITPHLDGEDSSDNSDNDMDDSDISSSSDSSDNDTGSSESSFKPSVKKIKTISEKTLYKRARKDYQRNKYIKIKVKQIKYTGVSGHYYIRSSKGYVYSWYDDAYSVKKLAYNESKHIKPKKGKTYTVFVSYSTSPRFLREYGCRGSLKGIVWELATVYPTIK